MSDERNPEQAGGLTEQAIGAQNLVAEELLDNPEQISSSEVTTPGDSSEEVTTPEISSGEGTTPEISSEEVTTPERPIEEVSTPETPPDVGDASEGPTNPEGEQEIPPSLEGEQEVPPIPDVTLEVSSDIKDEPAVPSDEVASGEVPLESTVDEAELTDKPPCDPCDPIDPYGLKSDPGCDLPICIPKPEEPQEDQETLQEELPLGEQTLLSEEESKSPGESSEVQEGAVSKETEDLGDPCADPEEPACDFPKPAEKNTGRLTSEELEGQEIGADLEEGSLEVSLPEGSPADSQENPVPEGAEEEPSALEQEQEIQVEVAVDPCGPKDPCGFQVDAACVVPVDASLPPESEDAGGTNPNTDREQE